MRDDRDMTPLAAALDMLGQRPLAVGGWAVAWAVCAGLNFEAGFRFFGLTLAFGFLAMAVLGAHAAHSQEHERGAKRFGLWVLVVMQLALGQWCGWQTLGISLSEGAGKLESNAGKHGSAVGALNRYREERDRIGATRPVASIAADLDLELRRTSKAYPNGDGPAATKLKGELGAAKRAIELDSDLIPRAAAALGKGGSTLEDAEAPYRVPMAIGTRVAGWVSDNPKPVTAGDVRFAFSIFFTVLLELVGTLGPWLFGIGMVAARNGPDAQWASEGPNKDDWGAPALGYRPRQDAAGLPFADGAPSHSTASAPVNVYVNGQPAGAAAPASAGASGVSASGAGAMSAPEAPAKAVLPARRSRQDLAAIGGDAPPVDRAGVPEALSEAEREAGDVILAFKAACVVDSPGGMLPVADVFRRYQAWAGRERAVDPATFERLLGMVAAMRTELIAGVAYVRHVALAAAKPRAVV